MVPLGALLGLSKFLFLLTKEAGVINRITVASADVTESFANHLPGSLDASVH